MKSFLLILSLLIVAYLVTRCNRVDLFMCMSQKVMVIPIILLLVICGEWAYMINQYMLLVNNIDLFIPKGIAVKLR